MKIYTSGLLLLSTCLLSLPVLAQREGYTSNSVLVCRARQCAETSYSMSKGFLFNKIDQMMKRNIGKAVLLCEADPVSHVCLQQGLTILANTPFEQVQVKIDGLKLTDAQLINKETSLTAVFDYKVQANSIFPKCQLGISRLNVASVDKVELSTNDFSCQVTETGNTAINATYNIDYLDFDYGFIGAYYTIGIGEALKGDKTGYVLMRFTEESPWNEETPETTEETVETEEMASENFSADLPDILKNTTPAESPLQEKEVLTEVPEEDKAVEETTEENKEEKNKENVSSQADQKSVEVQKEAQPKQKVVKTTIIEKTTILSDGTRQTDEPIKRTIIGDITQ